MLPHPDLSLSQYMGGHLVKLKKIKISYYKKFLKSEPFFTKLFGNGFGPIMLSWDRDGHEI